MIFLFACCAEVAHNIRDFAEITNFANFTCTRKFPVLQWAYNNQLRVVILNMRSNYKLGPLDLMRGAAYSKLA